MSEIVLEGMEEVRAFFLRAQRGVAGSNMAFWLKTQASPYLRDQVAQNFNRQGTRRRRWPKLSGYTRADRQRHGFPPDRPILIRTGALRDWLDRDAGTTSVDGVGATLRWPHPVTGELQSKFEAAQQGLNPNPLTSQWRPVPARPVAEIDAVDASTLTEAFKKWYEGFVQSMAGPTLMSTGTAPYRTALPAAP